MPMAISPRVEMRSAPPSKPSPSSKWEIPTLVRVDPFKPAHEQANIHTRWHPDIPACAEVELDKPFKVECMDYSGFQIRNDDVSDDVLDMDHDSDHHLSGPFWVPTAEPGDALEIDILDVAEHPLHPWGYCITYPGLGPLDRPGAPPAVCKTIWDFAGCEASSRHVPHVRFQGRAHPGVIGTAPSAELLAHWVEREGAVAEAQKRVHGPEGVGVALPLSSGAYVGQELDDDLRAKIYAEGARTTPGREHGGNIDIASLTRGSRVWLPVFVPGAKLSVGDTHFSQSEGEPTTAVEMPGIVTLRVRVVKDGVRKLGLTSPMYQTSPSEPTYPNKLVFTGLSVDTDGSQKDRDGLVAYRNAAWNAMQYLEKQGYSYEQAYVILSAAPVETKVVATANQPNFVVSVALPLDIFEFDIHPRAIDAPKPTMTPPALLSASRREEHEAHRVGSTNGTAVEPNGRV